MFGNSGNGSVLRRVRSSRREIASHLQVSGLRTVRLAAMEEWLMGFEKKVCWLEFANCSNWWRSGNCRLQPGHFLHLKLRFGHFLHLPLNLGHFLHLQLNLGHFLGFQLRSGHFLHC